MMSPNSNKLALVLLSYAIVLGIFIILPAVAEDETSTISGRVVDADGQPLDNVPLELAYVQIRKERGGAEDFGTSLNTQTDPAGNFTFANVTKGLVQFRVHSKTVLQLGELPNPTRVRVVKFGKMAFYPHFSGFPAHGRVTFSIKPGVDLRNVEIITEQLYKIKGKLVYKNGDPLALKVVKIDFNWLRVGKNGNYAYSNTREIHIGPDGSFFNVVSRPALCIISINYMGLSTESAPFMLNNHNSTHEVVLTLNGNTSDLIPLPLAENPDKKKQQKPRYIPKFTSQWIMNPANGNLYKWIACDGREDAQRQATDENAYLVTITSEQEQIWLEAMFGRAPYWIGLTDVEKEGKWQWENGEPVTYTNWKKKEYDPMENDDELPVLGAFGIKSEDQRRQEDEEDYAIMSSTFGIYNDDEFGKWEVSDSLKDTYIAIIEKDNLANTRIKEKK